MGDSLSHLDNLLVETDHKNFVQNNFFCPIRCGLGTFFRPYLRWLPTVLTVSTPLKRMKN